MESDANAGLPKSRWDAYRKLYSQNGIKLGVQRDKWGDVFVMVDSVGLLNRGHTSGYLHCYPGGPMDEDRFHPCTSPSERGQRRYDPKTRAEGYSFQRITGPWYAYDEGPS